VGLVQDFRTGLARSSADRPLVLLPVSHRLEQPLHHGPAILGNAVIVRDDLHLGASAYAMVEAAYGISMILGSLTVGRLGARLGYGRLLLLGIVLDGVTYIPLLACRSLASSLWSR